MPSAGSHVDERRSGIDRRSGFDRRGVEETASNLQRVFPHTRMSEQEASERALAIEAHRRELGQRLGRNVGAVVAAGDQGLSRVSGAIQKSLRGTDIAARLGGDEFAIILPDTDAVAGLIVATRIRRNLVESSSMMVTVSRGLVELPRDATQGSTGQLMLVADHALYAAKKAGGNCVVQREYQSEE